jgi:hypothetical protein
MPQRSVLALIALVALGACSERRVSSQATDDKLPASVSVPTQPWMVLFAAIRARDYEAAYGQMVPTYRGAISLQAFTAALQQNPLLAEHTDATTYSYGGGRGDGGSLVAEGAIATSLGAVRFAVFYVEAGGKQQILTLVVAGVPVVGLGVAVPSVLTEGSAVR